MIKNLFSVVMIFFSLSSAVAVELSQEQFEALQLAVGVGKYPVTILEKEVDGLIHALVLVGETHSVNQERYVCGQVLVNSFHLIGVEGIQLSEELQKELSSIDWFLAFFIHRAGSFPGPITVAVSRFFKEQEEMSGDKSRGVAILDASTQNPEEWAIQQNHSLNLLFLESYDPLPVEVITFLDSLIQKVRRFKVAYKTGLSLAATLSFAKCLGAHSFAKSLLVFSGLGAAGYFLNELRMSSRENLLIESMVRRRDQVMANQILKFGFERTVDRTMLVLCGEAHCPGILEILYSGGFRKV